jgi:hypothetical protein
VAVAGSGVLVFVGVTVVVEVAVLVGITVSVAVGATVAVSVGPAVARGVGLASTGVTVGSPPISQPHNAIVKPVNKRRIARARFMPG